MLFRSLRANVASAVFARAPSRSLRDPPQNFDLRHVLGRTPTARDAAHYQLGSLWRAGDAETIRWWELLGDEHNRGWCPAFDSQRGELAGSPAAMFGQVALRANYTGPLFDLRKVGEPSATTFSVWRGGDPDYAELSRYLSAGVGPAYVTKRYDQSGNGHHATQMVLASAPILRLDEETGTAYLLYDYYHRYFMVSQQVDYHVERCSGDVLEMRDVPPDWWAPGMTIEAGDFAASIVAINFPRHSVRVETVPAAPPATVTIAVPKVWMDLPQTLTSSLNTHAILSVGVQPPLMNHTQPVTLGCQGEAPYSAEAEYAMLRVGGSYESNFRAIAQTDRQYAGYSFASPFDDAVPHSTLAVNGYSRAGTSVRWVAEGRSGADKTIFDPGPATLRGGSLGFSNQHTPAGVLFGGDYESYADLIWTSALTSQEMTSSTQALCDRFGSRPQVKATIVFDGSSTTRGSGTAITRALMRKVASRLAADGPFRTVNLGHGQTIEAMAQNWPRTGGRFAKDPGNKLLVAHPGLGNSLQLSGSIPISAQDGDTLTTLPQYLTYPSTVSTGVAVTAVDENVLAPGTWLTDVDPIAGRLTLSSAPSGEVTRLVIHPDTDAVAIRSIERYCARARADGYAIVLVGSASRGSFNAHHLSQFRSVKAWLRQSGRRIADVYVDLEDHPAFAGDAPWLTSPRHWHSDQQHFTDLGYEEQAGMIATAVRESGLLRSLYLCD